MTTPSDYSTINRLIIVGNGFDLAHGLPTGYKNFINNLWELIFEDFKTQFFKNGLISHFDIKIEDNLLLSFSFSFSDNFNNLLYNEYYQNFYSLVKQMIESENTGYEKMQNIFNVINVHRSLRVFHLAFQSENSFLTEISKKNISNWVDIENEYYKKLKDNLNSLPSDRSEFEKVRNLNFQFQQIKLLLISYLNTSIENKYEMNGFSEIHEIFKNKNYNPNDLCEKIDTIGKIYLGNNVTSIKTLNFNYTSTPKLYTAKEDIINIHGSVLNGNENPIIFGFGDEIDKSYEVIENRENNEYLMHIKSFQYFHTPNYKHLLDFIDSNKFQVYLIGHSCGLSDRVLLNTIFEHENCISIKTYYYINKEGNDNHNDITMNISRHFKDKARMRKVVVNKTYCSPLPQVELKRIS